VYTGIYPTLYALFDAPVGSTRRRCGTGLPAAFPPLRLGVRAAFRLGARAACASLSEAEVE